MGLIFNHTIGFSDFLLCTFAGTILGMIAGFMVMLWRV